MTSLPRRRGAGVALSVLALGAAMLGGCVRTELHQSRDFGQTLAHDLHDQTLTPVADYAGRPAPPARGTRVSLAQDRYDKGRVIAPETLSASTVPGAGQSAPAAPPAP